MVICTYNKVSNYAEKRGKKNANINIIICTLHFVQNNFLTGSSKNAFQVAIFQKVYLDYFPSFLIIDFRIDHIW